jgi:hypothetical protein
MAGHDSRIRLVKLWNWAQKSTASEVVHRSHTQIGKLTEEELRRFVVDCALIPEVRANPYDTSKPEKLLEAAKRLRINTDDIRKTLKTAQVAKQETRGKHTVQTTTRAKGAKSPKAAAA